MHYRKMTFCGLVLFLAGTSVLLTNACQHESIPDIANTNPVPTPLAPCDSTQIYFQNDIMPYINSSCAIPGCHDNATPAAGINLTSYDQIMNSKVLGEPVVIPGNVLNSRLCRAIYALDLIFMPPPYNLQLPNKVKQNIVRWVDEGALNTACDARYDTISYKYSTDIAPMMRKYCSGCHYGDYASNGVFTTTYNQVRRLVDSNNILYKCISGNPGFLRMPTGNVTMPPCDVIKVRKWIENGALNN